MKKELKSYRKISARDFLQRLHISRFENCENGRYENEVYNDYINTKSCFSNFNYLTNEIIFKLIINAFRVKIKIIKFTTFSFLFRDKFAKIDFLVKCRVYLKYIYNDVIVVDEFINVRNDNRDNNV